MLKEKVLQKGFTLIEVLLAVAVLLVILTISYSAMSRMGRIQSLDAAGEKILSSLSEARMLSLSSDGSRRFGIHFEPDQIILFSEAYTEGHNENKVMAVFTNGIEVGHSIVGGGSEVLFQKITGETDNYGIITITGRDSRSLTLIIEESGNVEIQK